MVRSLDADLGGPVHVAGVQLLVDHPDGPGDEHEAGEGNEDNDEGDDALELAWWVELLGGRRQRVHGSQLGLVVEEEHGLTAIKIGNNFILTEEGRAHPNGSVGHL